MGEVWFTISVLDLTQVGFPVEKVTVRDWGVDGQPSDVGSLLLHPPLHGILLPWTLSAVEGMLVLHPVDPLPRQCEQNMR